MNHPNLTASEIKRLTQAGDWVQRLAESDAAELADEWVEWCDRDPRNLEAFEQTQRVWLSLARATAGDLRAPQPVARARRRRRVALAASVVLLIGACAGLAVHYFAPQAFATAIGEQRRIALVDGSVVDLAPDSRLRARFTPWRRDVHLERGEAFFSVTQGSRRPFEVLVAGLRITALGAAFDVRVGSSDTLVTVSEGRVDVMAEPQRVRADAGQQVTFLTPAQRLSVASVDAMVAGSWRSGTLQFLGEPLEEVVNEINRYAQRKIIVASAFQQTRFTGTVAPAQVGDWLMALEQIYAVEVVDRAGDAIQIQSREAHGAGS